MPAFTLAGIVLTQLWTLLSDQARRRSERAARLDPDKIGFYREYVHAGRRLLDLDVWPSSRTGDPVPTEPMLEQVRRADVDIAFAAPARVTGTAREATTAALALTAVIDGLRESTTRPVGGTLSGEPAESLADARRRLGTALDAFVRAARRDVGVTAPYLPMSGPE